MAYDEKSDFMGHLKEFNTCISSLKSLSISLNESAKVLDLGSGQGMHAGFLTNLFASVYCADIINFSSLYNGEFLKLLDEKYQRNGFSIDLDKISFNNTDAMDLIYKDNFFDYVITINTFEHIPNPQKALNEIVRVLKPKGIAYISFDPIWTADTGNHFSHRVVQPWAHLVKDKNEFIKSMNQNGANDYEVNDFIHGLNRKRLAYFFKIFEELKKQNVEILFKNSWSGVVDKKSLKHKNFKLAKDAGYSEQELLIRGLCFIIVKN